MEEMQKVEEEERKQVCPLLGSYTPVSLVYCSHPQTLRWFTPSNLNVVHTRNYLCFILSILRRLNYSAAIQELFSFLGIGTKDPLPVQF